MKQIDATNGGVALLKWLALVLMVGDHINKYLLDGSVLALFHAGRISAPLFTLVLAWNLARPGVATRAHTIALRLMLFGCAASPPFMALNKLLAGWYPLNILFSLACVAGVVSLHELARALHGWKQKACLAASVILFIVGGALVEFWWPLVALGVSAWAYFSRPSLGAAMAASLSMLALCLINQNGWALLSAPLFIYGSRHSIQMPRAKLFFYFFYPAHLAMLWLVRLAVSKA